MKYLSSISILVTCLVAGTVIAANAPDFKTLDANGDKAVSSAEWLQGGMALQKFQAMDKNKDGNLTMDEMGSAQQATPSASDKMSAPGEPGAVMPPDANQGAGAKSSQGANGASAKPNAQGSGESGTKGGVMAPGESGKH